MTGKEVLNSIIGKQKTTGTNADYARGYADSEKKYKQVVAERNAAIAQLKKLGYVIGEEPDNLKSASTIKKECRSRTGGCEGCVFETREGCSLNGKNPSEWRIV